MRRYEIKAHRPGGVDEYHLRGEPLNRFVRWLIKVLGLEFVVRIAEYTHAEIKAVDETLPD